MKTQSVALLSAYKKDDRLRAFAQGLVDAGWKLLASSGTKKFLDGHGIPSTDVADIVGAPILGHRVVTLSREIYAALLARLDNDEDLAELKRIGMDPISLVYVSLYPLGEEMQKKDCTFESVIEKTDIGGPTLLRAAAKGRRYVVSDPEQFDRVLEVLRMPPDSNQFRESGFMHQFLSGLAFEAEEIVESYAAMSADFHRQVHNGSFSQ